MNSSVNSKIIFCILNLCLVTLSCWADKIVNKNQPKYTEHRQVVFASDSAGEHIINPGEELTLPVNFTSYDYPVKRSIRITGAGQYPGQYKNRSESNFRSFTYHIDDYLDSAVTYNEEYSLVFIGNGERIERNAYYRISEKRLKSAAGKEARLEFPVKRENLSYREGGFLFLQLQFYLKKQGRHPDDIFDDADKTIELSVPAGSCDWVLLTKKIKIPETIACVLVRIGGCGFSGKCFVGSPKLIYQDMTLQTLPFKKYTKQGENWIGENLSSKEWPEFELSLDGQSFFSGKVFDRASQVTEFKVPCYGKLTGKRNLSIKLKDGFPARYPFAIRTVEILESSARDFEVVFVPELVHENKDFGILIKTNRPGIELKFSTKGQVEPCIKKKKYAKPGVYTVVFRAGKVDLNPVIIISDGKRIDKSTIKQVLRKNDDRIFISDSDDIYINRTSERFYDYLKWYMREGIGNSFVWRPSYQWAGVRNADPNFYKWATSLLEGLGMPYSAIIEGRTISGRNINPSNKLLAGPLFWGSQSHETDGAFYYWGNGSWWDWPFNDVLAKFRLYVRGRPVHTKKGSFLYFNPYVFDNMEQGSQNFVNNIARGKWASTRHTGPSTLFRYFFQAGYEWIGAELMYGPEEVTMSALRGANRAYGKKDYGTHLATQWSSSPFDIPQHATRLFLSLAISYIHGASHVNTEDALWSTECGFDRYSEAGREHILQQRNVFRFIQTHERRGNLVAPVAILQGRNDGWKCFLRSNVWSGIGDQWKFGPAEESMDLLNVFYPGSKLDAIYMFPCSNSPKGWYTSTPYGPIDITPIEAGGEVLDSYQAVALLGWNTYKKEDFEKLLNYTKNGGKLLLTHAHINTELKHNKPVTLPDEDDVLKMLLGDEYKSAASKYRRKVGKGEVICFPQKVYPADSSIRGQYSKELAALGAGAVDIERRKGWVGASKNIQFAAWDWRDLEHRTIYLLNIDWYSDSNSAPCTLLLGEQKFKLDVRRRFIEVITIYKGLAVMPKSMQTDILKIEKKNGGYIITVQTTGFDELSIFNKDKKSITTYRISGAGLHNIRI